MLAGLDGLGWVVVIAGAEVGIRQLKVLCVDQVADEQAKASLIDGVTRRMAGGKMGIDAAINNSVAVLEQVDLIGVAGKHLFP